MKENQNLSFSGRVSWLAWKKFKLFLQNLYRKTIIELTPTLGKLLNTKCNVEPGMWAWNRKSTLMEKLVESEHSLEFGY